MSSQLLARPVGPEAITDLLQQTECDQTVNVAGDTSVLADLAVQSEIGLRPTFLRGGRVQNKPQRQPAWT